MDHSTNTVLWILKQGFAGVFDALNFSVVWTVIKTSSQAQSRLGDILLYNGLISLGSLLLFTWYYCPLLDYLFDVSNFDSSFLQICCILVKNTLIFGYYILWIIPGFVLGFVINPGWLSTLSEESFKALTGKSPPTASFKGLQELPKQAASELYTATFYTMFLLQSFLCFLVPFLGSVLNMIFLCWLYSLYCFEYKWSHWSISTRLKYIEENWPYFVGFGLVVGTPFTLASYYYGFWVSYAIWWLEFPLFVITAIGAKPPSDVDVKGKVRFALFKIAKLFNMYGLNFLVWVIKSIAK